MITKETNKLEQPALAAAEVTQVMMQESSPVGTANELVPVPLCAETVTTRAAARTKMELVKDSIVTWFFLLQGKRIV